MEFNSTHKLIYSKSKDSLPITKTSVSKRPCLDPTSQSDNYLGQHLEYYPLELDKQKYYRDDQKMPICKDENDQDPRFKSLGIEFSDYQIQEESGVLQILRDLPSSESYVDLKLRK